MARLALLSLLSLLFIPHTFAQRPTPQVAPTVPGAYIAEFRNAETRESFYGKLGQNGHAVSHRMDLSYSLFKGVSFQLENVSTTVDTIAAARMIEAMPEVQHLWPVRIFRVPDDEVVWTGNDGGGVDAPSVAALRRRQLPANGTADIFSPHVMTQVDHLRAEGITGAGVRVAVIDTGVDYNHPALGGCFGPGCLVSFGTDLVGDNYSGSNIPVPDPDPHDNCEGHGTHVSGIIAAQANPFGFTGAAPDVTLGSYRVFGCGGSAGNDVLIAAYNQAYEDGADIITASIGGASGWSEEPWAVAVQRIVEAGVPCTVSAGNDGTFGQFYASTSANGKRVTAVASVDNILSPSVLVNATYSTGNSSSEIPFGWTPGTPADWGNMSMPLWTGQYNTTNPADACTPYPDSTPDLSDFIVLIRRGTCTFVEKVTNAVAKGARYVIIYNNAGGVSAVTADVEGVIGIGSVSAEQGAEWVNLLAAGTEVTLNIIDPEVATRYPVFSPNNVTGGFLSTYTSWGPTYELDVKPQYSAPGGNILSTYPLALGGYAVLSGTSMACPLAAATIALISQVRGTLDPAIIENLLSANANPNLFNDGADTYEYLAPVSQQGGGLVQAYNAAYSATLLSVSSLAFNDSDHFVPTLNFSIENTGTADITYNLSSIGAATAYTLGANGTGYPEEFPNDLIASYAKLTFSEESVIVPAGRSGTIEVAVTPPSGLNAKRLPVYSGYIALNASNGESLSLPYQGVYGSMHDTPVLDRSLTFLTKSTDAEYNPVAPNTTFTIPRGNISAAAANATVYPELVVSLFLGSAIVRADIIRVGRTGYGSNVTEVLGVKTVGSIMDFPLLYSPRGAQFFRWNGMMDDGTLAPAGSYAVLVRALRIFGDAAVPSEYDAMATVPFNIRYK
ncbi:hypothetical protein LTR56_021595 [Elasticomyces elasticus]|nr:hypothetical protein LTR56_021595 [Elasticomyces elasticus]KAK3630963.1 hypothetical protein LTR22_021294 [Elasticomyces elasticus]KAK4915927.1 hypothetical protein LTR49_015962 [Elasticomyces elasticus]KAK5754049.1 hypothetical protein LTS12_015903 [Elasticomyces elasticus]